ncbi:hypothetical protein EOM39_03645 [Candidatus Gracilibacteria bacterium]|nr:hypothetical protein [Candidatus Gracilibacteria bacterium]
MIDIIKKYRKHNLIKNTGLVAVSLVLALGINLFVSNSSLGQKLQISVINSGENSTIGDIYLVKNDNGDLSLKASKDMLKVKSISLSIAHNPTSLKITEIKNTIHGNLIKQETDPGLVTLVLNLKSPVDIKSNENIFEIKASKSEVKIENINIINANFTDIKNEVFLLSSSGVEY